MDVLAAHDRPADHKLRWTTPDQWHVTLTFLGAVPDVIVPELVDGLGTAGRAVAGPLEAVLGHETRVLGRGVLSVPVAGLDALVDSVRGIIGPLAGGAPERRFAGHLTLARARGDRPIPSALRGVPLSATWQVTEVCLVSSILARSGARYETLAAAPLGASA